MKAKEKKKERECTIKIKYLGINITKYVQDQYEENWKNSEKKSNNILKCIDIPCS